MSRLRYASLETKSFSFPGPHPLERPIIYSPEALRSLLNYHKKIAARFSVANPYFEYTQSRGNFVINEELANDVSLRVGPVGAFSHYQVAATIHEQTCLYIARGTMGKKFPANEQVKVEELLAIMMGGFSDERTVVLFEKSKKNGVKPIVGVQASPGTQDVELLQTMLNNFIEGNQAFIDSTLSTLYALRFSQINHELVRFLAEYGKTTELETVSMSRLYATTREESEALDVDIRGYPWIAMAALAIGIQASSKVNPKRRDPVICLYDTHEPSIQSRLETLFGMKLIEKDAVEPTEMISSSILRHHYLSKEHGGFQEDICIGYVPLEIYIEKALKLLMKHKIKIRN